MDSTKWWDFCDKTEVKDLLEQLNNGLIHPVEYAKAIQMLADKEGLS